MVKLNKCGYCGGNAKFFTEGVSFNGKEVSVERKFRIRCTQCGNELKRSEDIIIFASIDENGRVHENNSNLLMAVKEWNLLQQKIEEKKLVEEVLNNQ